MGRPRILMVEDEADVLSLNKQHLLEQGYEVDAARTLGEARAIVWERPPDLVLLDVMLPDGSGYDFCAEVRRITTAPIIYLTSMGGDENVVKGFMGGGDDYIVKPYSLDVLSMRVMAQLRRQGLSGAGRIELPPLAIDLYAGRATLGGEEIPLAPKELQLLAHLVSNAGQGFSAEELYRAVWDEPMGFYANTVRKHISSLKKKLKLDDGSPFELRLTGDRRYVFIKVMFG
ncbi:MAG: response regulator transcription factor [Oscillospiraceae bacterium]|nr:response regulator transcription factor [Oscillospiraceae bacterium]